MVGERNIVCGCDANSVNAKGRADQSTPAGGWRAELALSYASGDGRTALVGRRHSGPLSVQRPFFPEPDGTCHTYLLHPPAGIVGGDEIAFSVGLDSDSRVLITTPGASRFYLSAGSVASVEQTFTAASDTLLEWLPQETLVFDGARVRCRTSIGLRKNARYFGWEIIGLGRPASDLPFEHGMIDFQTRIERDGRLLYHERLHGTDGVAGLLNHQALMILIAVGAAKEALDAARVICSESTVLSASTLIGDVLICRALAGECQPLLKLGRALWRGLRPILTAREAVAPRIWNT